jgi:hypothetical protein
MSVFDVRVCAIRRRAGRRRRFEVRWHSAGRIRSFLTTGLADSYGAELVSAARKGLEFGPATGEPVLWAVPQQVTITEYQHAIAHMDMKWPRLGPPSRASVAEALATVTAALTRPTAHQPPARWLRAAPYRHAFNATTSESPPWTRPPHRACLAGRASLPIQQMPDLRGMRLALDWPSTPWQRGSTVTGSRRTPSPQTRGAP